MSYGFVLTVSRPKRSLCRPQVSGAFKYSIEDSKNSETVALEVWYVKTYATLSYEEPSQNF